MTERNSDKKSVFALTERDQKHSGPASVLPSPTKMAASTVQLDALPVSGRLQIARTRSGRNGANAVRDGNDSESGTRRQRGVHVDVSFF